MGSLSSENPYATIRDLPGGLRESSYMEMKGPPSGSPPRQPPPLRDGPRLPHATPQRDSGTYEQPSPLTHGEPSSPGAGAAENGMSGAEGERDRGGEHGGGIARCGSQTVVAFGVRAGPRLGVVFGSHTVSPSLGGRGFEMGGLWPQPSVFWAEEARREGVVRSGGATSSCPCPLPVSRPQLHGLPAPAASRPAPRPLRLTQEQPHPWAL